MAFGFGAAAYTWLTLPDVRPLRTRNPPTTAFIELRAREAAAKGETPRRVQRWVPYSRISSNLTRAVLVAEDATFWQHDGVDYTQLRDAVEVSWSASSSCAARARSPSSWRRTSISRPIANPVRKLRELLIARRLEAELSKQRILELYLNVIEWGDGIYGAEAAARQYFRTSASALTPQEASLLAAGIINPRYFDIGHPSTRLRRRQQMILGRLGLARPPQAPDEKAAPADAVPELPGIPAAPPDALPGEIVPPPAPDRRPRGQ